MLDDKQAIALFFSNVVYHEESDMTKDGHSDADTAGLAPPTEAGDVLKSMEVPEYPGTYVVGRRATRLTFLSQQQRALNLVWALHKESRIGKNTPVAVVGGGLAGVTAAAAASLLGARVTLLEAKGSVLHLQRGAQLRFVHPNIYEWPAPGSDLPITDLPFFNWGAGTAASVVGTVARQWDQIAGGVSRLCGYHVRRIHPLPEGGIEVFAEGPSQIHQVHSRTAQVETTASSLLSGAIRVAWSTLAKLGLEIAPQQPPSKGRGAGASGGNDPVITGITIDPPACYTEIFQIVILAVGFGLERQMPPVPFLSYWENDNFGRDLITPPIPRHYLVSGCGDGGLIDAIRLRLSGFDHADFVYRLLHVGGLDGLKNSLPGIDAAAERIDRTADGKVRVDKAFASLKCAAITRGEELDTETGRRRAVGVAQSEFLAERYEAEYDKLEGFAKDELRRTLLDSFRPDTVVYLNSPDPTPYTLGSAILNRFAVFLIMKFGGLRYRSGRCELLSRPAGSFRVAFHRDNFPTEELEVHEVVIRHGFQPALDYLLPKYVIDRFPPPPHPSEDKVRSACYPSDYWLKNSPAHKTLRDMRRRVHIAHAAANIPRAVEEYVLSGNNYRLAIDCAPEDVRYVVTAHDAGAAPESDTPKFFEGVPVFVERPTHRRPHKSTAPVRPLLCGLPIGWHQISLSEPWTKAGSAAHRLASATLGCFVRIAVDGRAGDPALLTVAGVLGSAEATEARRRFQMSVFTQPPEFTTKNIIAAMLGPASGMHFPIPSPPGPGPDSGLSQINKFDVAFAPLVPGMITDNRFPDIYGPLPALQTAQIAKPTDPVFKVGAASNLTRGRVSGVGVRTRIPYRSGLCWFEDLIAVEPDAEGPFYEEGDAGAVVVREDGAILGLLIGSVGDVAFACPMLSIFTTFGCELLPAGVAPDSHKPMVPSVKGGAARAGGATSKRKSV